MVHLLISGAVFIHRPDFPFHVCSRPIREPQPSAVFTYTHFHIGSCEWVCSGRVPPRPPHVAL